jgi:site-specific DNA-methyltransferase (adenine-specific)
MNTNLVTGKAHIEILLLTQARGRGWCDLTMTSPPYNIGVRYADEVQDNLSQEEYEVFTRLWLAATLQATNPKGSLFLNVGSLSSNPMLPFDVLAIAAQVGWKLQNTFHWIKSISFPGKDGEWVSRGQFKPINSERYVNNMHEYVFHLTPEGNTPLDKLAVGVPYQDKTNVERWSGKRDKRCRGNVWFIPYPTVQAHREHPAVFPVALAEMCIKIGGCPRVVMDPFVGSGSSGVAAAACGVSEFVGIDLSPTYIGASKDRLRNADVDTSPPLTTQDHAQR